MALEKLKTQGTLSDKAYKSLKDNILSLELKPGEVLLEDRLSEMLGISRTPIREALKKLAYEGLVSYSVGKGNCVTELNMEYFLNIYTIRDSLETLAVRLATKNRTEADIKNLRKLIADQTNIANQTVLDDRHYLEVDRRFHIKIASSSKNDMLVRYLNQINESYNRYLFFTRFDRRAIKVIGEHTEIIDAIEEGNAKEAIEVMIGHLNGVRESIETALINAGKY